jgi:hypothetical protein
MIHSSIKQYPVGSNPSFMKAGQAPRVTSCLLALVAVLTLLLLGHGFADNLEYGIGSWQVPAGQPDQMWSRIHYDPKLSDPFFESNEWSYPWWIIKHSDGHFESTRSDDERPVKDPPRLKHTAKCFSTSFGSKHLARFCEAKLLDVNMIDLLIHEFSPAFRDALRVQIRKEKFTSQYWTLYIAGPPPDGYKWKTKRQKLTLDKKVYRKGDEIKGRVDFECVEEIGNPKYVEKWGRNPTSIKVYGVFKTIFE